MYYPFKLHLRLLPSRRRKKTSPTRRSTKASTELTSEITYKSKKKLKFIEFLSLWNVYVSWKIWKWSKHKWTLHKLHWYIERLITGSGQFSAVAFKYRNLQYQQFFFCFFSEIFTAWILSLKHTLLKVLKRRILSINIVFWYSICWHCCLLFFPWWTNFFLLATDLSMAFLLMTISVSFSHYFFVPCTIVSFVMIYCL